MATIVICEDDAQVGNFLRSALTRNKFLVEVVGDGASCLETCRKMLPDLLLLDLKLPDMEGTDLIRQLRQQSPRIKIMVVSGATDERLQEAWLSGADFVIRKPASVANLVQTATRLIANAPTTV